MNLDPGVGGGPCIHFRLGFFFDGGDHHRNALSARGVEQQKWKSPVAGDQTQPVDRLCVHPRSYLITPRCDASINVNRYATEGSSSPSARKRSSSWEVFSLAARRMR